MYRRMTASPGAPRWPGCPRAGRRLLAGIVVCAGIALALPLTGGRADATVEPGQGCFWSPPLTFSTDNVAFPDTHAAYWYTSFQLAPGQRVVLHGRYGAERYFSLNSYISSGVPTDAIHDSQTVPDRGSQNPFLPGAWRLGGFARNWTVTVTGDLPPPAGQPRQPNTLYAGTIQGNVTQPVVLIYRVYVPDIGADLTGSAGLPQPTLVNADNTTATGQVACTALQVNTTFPAPSLMPLAQYNTLTHLPAVPSLGIPGSPASAPATSPASWYAFTNSCHLTDPFFQAAGYPLATPPLSPPCSNIPAPGQWSNIDNGYVYTYLDRDIGPAAGGNNIVVLHGKIPTTPRTYYRTPIFQGGTQLRYWSLCNAQGLVTTATTGCVYDQQVPVDANGYFTVVISTPADRPPNAIPLCGVAWISWDPNGDGAGNPTKGLVILRNMLPDPSFAQAIQNIAPPGLPANVAATMGPYLPTVQYETPAQFAATRCHIGR